ncbi:LPS biosynthesis protein WbpG [Pyruvatibacter mobilis]|nr:LPS biosynthesis protein WbpG [Pyruvatibacter mobilis]
MDSSDPNISFDERGVCNHCQKYDEILATLVYRGAEAEARLDVILDEIKKNGSSSRYDCIIGLSGGVDSTYVAYKVKQLGLRPLAVHLDNGWNSEAAVHNIESVIRTLDIDLHTEVLDWEEFRHLQIAFLRASTPDSEIPTDHAIMATLYKIAIKHRVNYIISGSNYVTELMVPSAWSNGHSDWKYIWSINREFGTRRLKTYPHYTYWKLKIEYAYLRGIRDIQILNYIDYDKHLAIEEMEKRIGWRNYGGKHYESIYTRFYQGYLLPIKFGYDKRRSHLSCLINSGHLTRDQALAELQRPPLDEEQAKEDCAFVQKKLGLSEEEFQTILHTPPRRFQDYPSYDKSQREDLLWRLALKAMMTARSIGRATGLLAT